MNETGEMEVVERALEGGVLFVPWSCLLQWQYAAREESPQVAHLVVGM